MRIIKDSPAYVDGPDCRGGGGLESVGGMECRIAGEKRLERNGIAD